MDFHDPAVVKALEAAARSADGGQRGNLGPWMLGMVFDAFLLGIVLCQFATWQTYSSQIDRPIVRALVYHLLLCALGISGYLVAYQLHLFAFGFGRYIGFIDPRCSSPFYLLSACSRVPCGLFFAERAWLLSGRSIILGAVLLSLSAVTFASAVAAKVLATELTMAGINKTMILLWQCSELTTDVLTTSTIAFCLFRSRTGWNTTDKMISRLLVLTAETMLPPTLGTLGFIVALFGTSSSSTAYFFVCTPKLHTICLLAVLNQRISFRQGIARSSGDGSGSMSQPVYAPSGRWKIRGKGKHAGMGSLAGVENHSEIITHVIDEPRQSALPGLTVNGRPLRLGRPSQTVQRDVVDIQHGLAVDPEPRCREQMRSGSPETDGSLAAGHGSKVRLV